MKKFKPPKVIYISSIHPPYGCFDYWIKCDDERKDIKYVRIPKNWKKKFKEQFPMLANDTAGVIGFIERMVGE